MSNYSKCNNSSKFKSRSETETKSDSNNNKNKENKKNKKNNSNMNNINIKNIFANNIIQNNSQEKPPISISDFSVNTLMESNTFKTTISDDYIVNKIKMNKINEKKKIDELYEELYKECLIKINTSLELNITDIIFSAGTSYFGYPTYNSYECIKYIETRLKEKNFLTMILSNKDIFISWKNIN